MQNVTETTSVVNGKTIRRIRKVSTPRPVALTEEGMYRGFNALGMETEEKFHDRMFGIPALEAACYELEFALEQCAAH
jgi:hypothetical protein